MFKKSVALVRKHYTRGCQKFAVGSGLLFSVGSAMAADGDGSIDTTSMLLAIAGALSAALLVSVAYSAATISVKASKLPRRGA